MNLHSENVMSEEAYDYMLHIIHTLREEIEVQQVAAYNAVDNGELKLGAYFAVDGLLQRIRKDLTDTARLAEYHKMKTEELTELTEQAINKE